MKKILLICICFSLSLSLYSQDSEKMVFDQYYLKSSQTGNRPFKMNQELSISKVGPNQFLLEIFINNTDNYKVALNFIEEIEFAGSTYYTYEGLGELGGMELNFSLESALDLGDFLKGEGYKSDSDQTLDKYELHLFYWPFGTSEPLRKTNSYFYPVLK